MKLAAVLCMSLGIAACGGSDAPPAGSLQLLAGAVGVPGYVDSTGESARFLAIADIAVGRDGTVYVADADPSIRAIRKISADGRVSTLAGGPGNTIFSSPLRVAADAAGNVYVADLVPGPLPDPAYNTVSLRKVTPAGVTSTVVAGVPGGIQALAIDPAGTPVMLTLRCGIMPGYGCGYSIVRVAPDGTTSNVPGRGFFGACCGFFEAGFPDSMTIGANGAMYLIDAPAGDVLILAVTPEGAVSVVSRAAGIGHVDGPLDVAQVSRSNGFAFKDDSGDFYLSDPHFHTIRRLRPGDAVTTIAGVPGQAGFAAGPLPGLLTQPGRLAFADGDLYIALPNAVAVIRRVP